MKLAPKSVGSWLLLVVTVIAATASAIAAAQFRAQADQYRQTQLRLARLEAKLYRLEAQSAPAALSPSERRQQVLNARRELLADLNAIEQQSSADLKLHNVTATLANYLRSDGTESEQRAEAFGDLVAAVRAGISEFDEAAQNAIWRADVEALLGLLAFVVSLAAILWRFGIATHKTAVIQAEQRMLERSEHRFRTLTDNSYDLIAILDRQFSVQYLSSSVEHVLGYTKQQLTGKGVLEVVHPDDRTAAANALKVVTSKPDHSTQFEMRCLDSTSNWRDLEVFARNQLDSDAVNGIVLNARDVTERKRAEDKLLHDAFHDALTELPNRALFLDRLQRAVNRARRHPNFRFAVLFIDLDRFKLINDSLGHAAGDRLIVEIASRLQNCIRQVRPQMKVTGDDTLARLGGDEFTILVDELQDPSDAIRIAERLLHRLEEPFELNGVEIVANASVGIAISSPEYQAADEVLRDADIAMYRAKANGGGRFEVFDAEMHTDAVSRLQLEADLRRALERREFEVVYQPIFSMTTSKVESIEALIRWNHPKRGMVPPSQFISIAEDTGLIVMIGHWVLRQACRDYIALQRSHPDTVPSTVSVNVSAREFNQPDLIEQIKCVLEEEQMAPASLRIEITETVAMANPERVAGTLRQLRALGVRISIDDFGTGYSSLSYLRKFPLDALKIDRSFVTSMDSNGESREIVRTIINLASNLQLEVIAEGAETSQQAAALQELRCKYVQGYLFSRPVAFPVLMEKMHSGFAAKELCVAAS